MRTLIFAFLVPSLTVASSIAQAQEGQTFRYKAETGQKFYYSISTSMEQSQKVNGADISNKVESKTIVEREVLDPDEKGNFVFRTRTLHMTAALTFGPLGEYKYDSKSTENETGSAVGVALTPIFDAMSGAIVDVTISPQGKVLKVKGLKEAIEGAIDKDNPIAAQVGLGMGSEETAKINYSEYFVQFPEDGIAAGETWEIPYQFKLANLGNLEGKTTNNYDGPETVDGRRLHRISGATDMKGDIEFKVAGIEVAGKVSISGSKTTSLFDTETGSLVSRVSEVTSDGDLISVVGDMTIPIQQSQTQKVEIKQLDGPPRDE